MTIAVLNYNTQSVDIIEGLTHMDNEESIDFLFDMGYNLDEIEWMSTDSDNITINRQ
jgi:hypothetical protein